MWAEPCPEGAVDLLLYMPCVDQDRTADWRDSVLEVGCGTDYLGDCYVRPLGVMFDGGIEIDGAANSASDATNTISTAKVMR